HSYRSHGRPDCARDRLQCRRSGWLLAGGVRDSACAGRGRELGWLGSCTGRRAQNGNTYQHQEVTTMDANRPNQFALLIGRVMVGGMYLYSGITNLLELGGRAGYAASKGLPDAQLWVTLASLLLVVAGLSLLSGVQPRLGIGAVALFLIPVSIIMHNFWA